MKDLTKGKSLPLIFSGASIGVFQLGVALATVATQAVSVVCCLAYAHCKYPELWPHGMVIPLVARVIKHPVFARMECAGTRSSESINVKNVEKRGDFPRFLCFGRH